MNSSTEKIVTVVLGRSSRRDLTFVPEMRLADIRAALQLPETYSFSLTRDGPSLAPDTLVFQQVKTHGRLYARHGQRMEQLTLALDSPDAVARGP